MKRILVFLGLKVAEVGGAFGVFAVLSFAHSVISTTAFGARLRTVFIDDTLFYPGLGFWMNGANGCLMMVFVLMLLAMFALIGLGVWLLIKMNWDWSRNLIQK